MTTSAIKKLRWAFSNRVVAQPVAVENARYALPGDFLSIGPELRRVHSLDVRALLLYVY